MRHQDQLDQCAYQEIVILHITLGKTFQCQCWEFQKADNFVDITHSIFWRSIFMFRKDELNNIMVYSMDSVYIFDPFAHVGAEPYRGHMNE